MSQNPETLRRASSSPSEQTKTSKTAVSDSLATNRERATIKQQKIRRGKGKKKSKVTKRMLREILKHENNGFPVGRVTLSSWAPVGRAATSGSFQSRASNMFAYPVVI